MLSGLADVAVSTHKDLRDRDLRAPPRRRTPTGLLLHVGAGAVLVVVMLAIAFYVFGM